MCWLTCRYGSVQWGRTAVSATFLSVGVAAAQNQRRPGHFEFVKISFTLQLPRSSSLTPSSTKEEDFRTKKKKNSRNGVANHKNGNKYLSREGVAPCILYNFVNHWPINGQCVGHIKGHKEAGGERASQVDGCRAVHPPRETMWTLHMHFPIWFFNGRPKVPMISALYVRKISTTKQTKSQHIWMGKMSSCFVCVATSVRSISRSIESITIHIL